MIDLYTAATGNGHRAGIMVAESGLPFAVHKIDLQGGENKQPAYRHINPAGLIPAIIDSDGPGGKPITVVQSGAIVLYLAQKIGQFMPHDLAGRTLVMQWFMQACTDIAGTNAAITLSTTRVSERSEPTIRFFEDLMTGYFHTIDVQLTMNRYLASDLSVADFALFPHFVRRKSLIEKAGLEYLLNWGLVMAARPGVAKGMSLAL